ncbi:ABC transporter permease [Clostridium carboxidivorans P7]|uniref:Polar amino acid ABC transporter, inner membrane subunit n=1 Tax=Clostridium carboxidivorans P7 TaxID=536227 RepID=C6PWK2_9CLOT|nr:amino acid ABC transporter permease [Clostridium carboxidivorans]AKN30814.1 ABC transporter permease [Clostridium carboxidivorans P7]EET86355.1 polar amino acid ABC transporter, inner membrane subunit [Clostridium carboxidivorans P7]EFG88477.1 ABC transporter, permease protein [Clostridium carboxidivorans P7]
MKVNFDINYMMGIFPLLLKYTHLTISLALISMILGLSIALILVIILNYDIKLINPLLKVYISFFRGTPLLVQLFLLYYGLPQIIPILKNINAYTAAIIGLSMNSSAYMVEILRGAIGSVDKGQMEAVKALGMTSWQGMKRIVLPQAARVAIPALGNTFVDLLKSSSLAFTLGVAEILAQAQMSAAATYKFFENYLAVALIYWVIIIFFNHIQKILEVRMNHAY